MKICQSKPGTTRKINQFLAVVLMQALFSGVVMTSLRAASVKCMNPPVCVDANCACGEGMIVRVMAIAFAVSPTCESLPRPLSRAATTILTPWR